MSRFLLLLLLSPLPALCQYDSAQHVNKKRLVIFTAGSTVVYGGAVAGLSQLWYKDSGYQSFRFFNDIPEWKQMDKMGHFYSSFYFSYGVARSLKWCDVKRRKSDLIGALAGFAMLLPIEILDGHSEAYGASAGDLIANTTGALFYLGQARLWNEIRITPKFSFHRTGFAKWRPETLGDGLSEEIIKDYNGQTHWLSVDMDKFRRFPRWLNVAVGYGAQGMVYARDHENVDFLSLSPYRQFYVAVDPDLTAINSNSKAIRTILFLLNTIKLPAPAIEISRHGAKFHPFYF